MLCIRKGLEILWKACCLIDHIDIILGFIAPFYTVSWTVRYYQQLGNITIPWIVFWTIWYFEIKGYAVKTFGCYTNKDYWISKLHSHEDIILWWNTCWAFLCSPLLYLLNLSVPGVHSRLFRTTRIGRGRFNPEIASSEWLMQK